MMSFPSKPSIPSSSRRFFVGALGAALFAGLLASPAEARPRSLTANFDGTRAYLTTDAGRTIADFDGAVDYSVNGSSISFTAFSLAADVVSGPSLGAIDLVADTPITGTLRRGRYVARGQVLYTDAENLDVVLDVTLTGSISRDRISTLTVSVNGTILVANGDSPLTGLFDALGIEPTPF